MCKMVDRVIARPEEGKNKTDVNYIRYNIYLLRQGCWAECAYVPDAFAPTGTNAATMPDINHNATLTKCFIYW